ncbi:MAG: hypothetical protein Q7T83_01420 [Thermodesulfovibrionales bacterium]|nr:hypothetical protein [Thermodesulfovibrionales bacterium]
MKTQGIFPAHNTLCAMRYALFLGLTVFLFLIPACVTPAKIADDKKPLADRKKLPVEEQEQKVNELFGRILSLTEEAEDRQSVVPKMEALYDEIINNYPDVPLVEETYWRLIALSVEDLKPPKVDKAEKLYKDFLRRYPDSTLTFNIEQALGQFYYVNKMWDRLLRIFTPYVKKFIATGKLDRAYHLFMFSEAKFNLGDLIEAEKGYKIVIEFFPKTSEGETSQKRLEEIKKLKK